MVYGFYALLVLALVLLLLIFIHAYLNSAAIGLAKNILTKRGVSFKQINEYGKKFFWRYFLIDVIIGLLILVWLVVLVLP